MPLNMMDEPIRIVCARHGLPVTDTVDGMLDLKCDRCRSEPDTGVQRSSRVRDALIDAVEWSIIVPLLAVLLIGGGVYSLIDWGVQRITGSPAKE